MKKVETAFFICLILCVFISGSLFAAGNQTGVCIKLQKPNPVYCFLNNTQIESNTGSFYTMEGISAGRYLLRISEMVITNGISKEHVIFCNYIDLPAGKMLLLYIDSNNILHIAGERKIEMA